MATEKRLIKLQKRLKFAGDVFEALMKQGWSCTEAMDFVNSFQDADAVEVVHGRWLHREDNGTPMHECSECGARVVKGLYEYENPNRYCYRCGAKMDLKGE